MTIELFIFLFTIGSGASSLLTQALKFYSKNLPSNVLALVSAIMVGVLGTVSAYILMEIDFTLQSTICIALMSVCIWVGSMVGYDKIMQLISQMRG